MKTEVEPKQVDIESLNQKGQDLAKDAQPADQVVVKEPLSSVNRRWDNLLEGIGERQVGKKSKNLDIYLNSDVSIFIDMSMGRNDLKIPTT